MTNQTWSAAAPTKPGFYWLWTPTDKRVYELRHFNGGLKVVTLAPPGGASGFDQSQWAIPQQIQRQIPGAQWLGPIEVPPDP